MLPPEIVTIERELLDTVQRWGRTPQGRVAIHVRLSHLLPANKTPAHLRIAARLFAPLELAHEVRVFPLSNGDIVVLCKEIPKETIVPLIHRLRALFADDPLCFMDHGKGPDPFFQYYNFLADYPRLAEMARGQLRGAEERRRAHSPSDRMPVPLEPADLEPLIEGLRQIDVRQTMRRQACIRIEDGRARILFEEFFLSMEEIRTQLAPGKALMVDRWLFQEFSRALDSRLLVSLPQTEAVTLPRSVSLNLNLESTDTPEFQGILNLLEPGRTLVVEVQVIDVFNNLLRYQATRDRLRREGHAILIDGVNPAMVEALDLPRLDPDFVKLLWSGELIHGSGGRRGHSLADNLEALGLNRVILSRCDSDIGVSWGMDLGIQAFQGHYLDAVVATITLHQCPASAACKLRQCVTRRAAVEGKLRRECPYLPGLDLVQAFAAPRRRHVKTSVEDFVEDAGGSASS